MFLAMTVDGGLPVCALPHVHMTMEAVHQTNDEMTVRKGTH